MPEVRQPSVASGEISPSLYGASDRPFYAHGARTTRNLFVSKYHTLLNRAGTVFLHEVKDSTKLTRLLPFTFSSDQAYAIEAGDLNFRVTKADGTQLVAEEFIALGGSSARARSTDKGATWSTPPALPATAYLGACQGSNGRIIAIGSTANATVSDDGGATWLAKTIPTTAGNWLGIASNGRSCVAVSTAGDIAFSADNGDTWVGVANPPAMTANSVAWGNGRWIVVGFTGAFLARYSYSYDGATWTAPAAVGDLDTTYPAYSFLWGVCYLFGQFIAVGSASTDGGTTKQLLWCRLGMLSSNWKWGVIGSGLGRFYGIATDGKTAVAVGASNALTARAYKYDPVSALWTDTSPAAGSTWFNSVAYSRGYWAAAGSSRISRYNGTSWADMSPPAGDYQCIAACKGTDVVEVTTPYPTALVRNLAAAQSGDVVTIFHPFYPPKEWKRYGEQDWRLDDWYKTPPTQTVQGLVFVGTPDQTGDATHPIKEWQWVVTWEDEETGRESLVSAALTPGGSTKITLYPDKPVSIRWNVIEKAKRYWVYRGRNGEFGFVGTVAQPALAAGASPTTVDFRDDGQSPIYEESPPSWTNPFQSDLSYPACGCYFDDRLVVSGSIVQPATVRGSAVADYYNFDTKFLTTVADSFEFTLSTRRYEQARWLVPLESLIVGTSESEWVVGGANGEALSSESVVARARSSRGSTSVQPVVVGQGVIYVQNGGKVVRDFAFMDQAAGWGGRELSMLSQHLLEGYTVVDMAYAKEPLSIVWLVRSDGALLSLTFLREQQLWAWARHDTGGDVVEAVTSVPNGSEDVLFLIVKRAINGATKRYVEMLATRSPTSVSTGVFLDCAKTVTQASSNTTTGLSHLEARTVGVLADGTYRGTYTVSGGSVTFTGAAATTVVVGLPITADFESLDFPEGRIRKKIVSQVGVEYRLNPAVTDTAAGVQIGQDLSTLSDIRKFSDAQNDTLFVPVDASYNPGGRCALRHTQPFPLEIRGITRVISDGH